jgi:hypothetical protein
MHSPGIITLPQRGQAIPILACEYGIVDVRVCCLQAVRKHTAVDHCLIHCTCAALRAGVTLSRVHPTHVSLHAFLPRVLLLVTCVGIYMYRSTCIWCPAILFTVDGLLFTLQLAEQLNVGDTEWESTTCWNGSWLPVTNH